jgi:flagellar export protein FliJ
LAFDFKFGSLLKHRRRLEEAARRNFLTVQSELDECLALIKEMYRSIDQARIHISNKQTSGAAQALAGIHSAEHFISGQLIKIKNARDRAREIMTRVEEMREKAIEAAKEFKKIDKLRERMLATYKDDLRDREASAVDDLMVLRGKRGRPK